MKPELLPNGMLSTLYMAFPRALFWLQRMPDLHSLKQVVRSQQLQVLHVHKHFPAYAALRARSALGIPVLFDVHGIMRLQREDLYLLGESNRSIYLHLKAEANAFRHADAIGVVSDRMKRHIVDHFNLTEDKVHVIPDAVDVQLFERNVSEKEKEELRVRHSLAGKRVVLFAGRFKKLGGIVDLLEAYRYVVDQIDEKVALVMIGDGPLLPDVQEFRKRESLEDLTLVGVVPHAELPKYQALADVLVVPEIASEYNDMVPHIKLLECLASGRPTVATRLTTISDIIEDGRNGILVEPGQPRQLGEGIMRVLRDESLQRRLSQYGKQVIDHEKTWDYSAQQAAAAYRAVLVRKRT